MCVSFCGAGDGSQSLAEATAQPTISLLNLQERRSFPAKNFGLLGALNCTLKIAPSTQLAPEKDVE